MEKFLWICLAGAVGSGLRYLVTLWAGERLGALFPYGTLIVNLVGCFAIAFLIELSLRVVSFSPELRLVLATGFLGGLTTYSSYNFETLRLLQTGAVGAAGLYVALTTLGGLALGYSGFALARRVAGG